MERNQRVLARARTTAQARGEAACVRRVVSLLARAAHDERGQATVEAAFALPVVMLLVLLLLQPGIVLYDRVVMQSAAAEGCRLLATSPGETEEVHDYLRRRLSAVPEHDLFHVHGGGSCAWTFEIAGGESSPEASVAIVNELKPLPLLDVGATLLGLTNERGNLEIRVEARAATQPSWVAENEQGLHPEAWIGAWV